MSVSKRVEWKQESEANEQSSIGPGSKRKEIQVDAVYDLETEKWDRFLAGGLLYRNGSYRSFRRGRENDLLDALLKVTGENGKGGHVWAHNGGVFDHKWLLDRLLERELPVQLVAAGARVVALTVKDGPTFLDSKALTMISLEDFTEGAGVEKQKLGFPCRCCALCKQKGARQCQCDCVATKPKERGKPQKHVRGCCMGHCGGYCTLSGDMPKARWARMLEYLEADCRSLMAALDRLVEFAAVNDLDLGRTVGGSSWACARRWLDLPPAELSKGDHQFARAGYFGGRTQLFRPYAPHGYEYDVASMYPSRLAFCALPWGAERRVFGATARQAWLSHRPGVYRAQVDVPEMHLPPLPLRDNKRQRIAYPVGEFEGVWTAPELAYAEGLGVKVRVVEALTWPEERILFKSWVDRMFDLRVKAPGGKSGPMGTFLKFLLNSLTGKLGSRPEHSRMDIHPEVIRAHKVDCSGKDELDKCSAHVPYGTSGVIWLSHRWHLDPCSHVEWAGYLTAQARIEWHKQATSKCDGQDAVYGDTDSIFALEPRTHNIGNALGQWEEKGTFTDFEGIAPKVYLYRRSGKLTVKGKGLRLPRKPELAATFIRPGPSGSTRPVAKAGIIGLWRGATHGHFFEASTLQRQTGRGYGDRVLEPGADMTRPPTADEIFGSYQHERERNAA